MGLAPPLFTIPHNNLKKKDRYQNEGWATIRLFCGREVALKFLQKKEVYPVFDISL